MCVCVHICVCTYAYTHINTRVIHVCTYMLGFAQLVAVYIWHIELCKRFPTVRELRAVSNMYVSPVPLPRPSLPETVTDLAALCTLNLTLSEP